MSDDFSEARVSVQEPSSPPAPDQGFSEMDSTDGVLRATVRVLERISDGFVALDTDWRYTYANQRAAQILGCRSPQDLIGKAVWKEYPAGIGQNFYQACHQSLAEQIPLEVINYYPPFDCWLENRIYPSPDGLSIFFQDVTERRRDQERLRESERRLAEAQEIARLGSWEWDIQNGGVNWSRELLHLVGWPEDAPPPNHDQTRALVHPDDLAHVTREVTEAAARGSGADFENRLVCPDGRELIVHIWGQLVRDAEGQPLRLMAVAQDVTEQRATEAALRESQEHFQAIAEATPASIVISRLSAGSVLYANPFARQFFGVPPEADVTRYFVADFYQHPEDRAEIDQLLLTQPSIEPQELAMKHQDGTPLWAIGSFQRLTYRGDDAVLAIHHDITERKQVEAMKGQFLMEAQERADRDPLTDLFNHRVFQKRLEEEAARAQRHATSLAVVMLDLDNFKFFNDMYGHAVGDEVLRLVARRLQQVCRPYDTVARFGGDEFAVLMPSVSHNLAAGVEARLREDMAGLSYHPPGAAADIPITVSVGAALYPYGDQDRHEALRQADERLLRSKMSGAAESESDQIRRHLGRSLEGFSMLDALVTAVDNKDRYTRHHSEDVREYSLNIARQLGLDEEACQAIGVAALLHDVGKIGVPDRILRKPGKLTEEEFNAVKQHPMMGAALVSTVPGLEATLGAVRHHHERWDGGGYPFGLKGEETPLAARLMSVADAFCAITTDRPYRKGIRGEQALAILEAGAGSQWDPQCVTAFLQTYPHQDEGE